MGEHYILPSELAALIAFWFVPPLLIAFLAQSWFFAARGVFHNHRWRAVSALVATACISIIVGLAILVASPKFLPDWLGVEYFAGGSWPVLPLSFVTVALIAAFFAWWGARYERSGA
jgi:hypothetical protein